MKEMGALLEDVFLFLIRRGAWKVCKLSFGDAQWTFVPIHSEFVQNTIVKNWVSSFGFLGKFPWDAFYEWRHTRVTIHEKWERNHILNLPLFWEIFSRSNESGSCFIFIIFSDWFLMEGEIPNSTAVVAHTAHLIVVTSSTKLVFVSF